VRIYYKQFAYQSVPLCPGAALETWLCIRANAVRTVRPPHSLRWSSAFEVGSHEKLVEVEVEVKLRPTFSRPVRLGVRHPTGTRDQFFFLLEIFFRQLRVCYFVAPCLTRGRFCNLLLLMVLARAVPRDSRQYFIVPILETPPTWKASSLYLYPPGTGWPIYTPGHQVPFPFPLTIRRATVEVFYPTSTRN
jgi:hypothetical protein